MAQAPEGEADVLRTTLVLEVGPDAVVATVRPEVRASGAYAVVAPLVSVEAGAPVDRTDGARVRSLVEQTSPRWVAYSSGCGSADTGGATPEDLSETSVIEAPPVDVPGAQGAVVHGTLASALSGLRSGGYQGHAAELETDDEGDWLVMEVGTDLPADAPSPSAAPSATTFRVRLGGGPPAIDLRTVSLGRSRRSDIVAIVLADGPMTLEGLPLDEMKPPGAAPKIGEDIAEDYGRWIDARVDFAGIGGAVALLEFSGPVVIDGEARHAVRYRIAIPSGVAVPDQVSFVASDTVRIHRVRAIVGASVGGTGTSPLGWLFSLLAVLALSLSLRLRRWSPGLWVLLLPTLAGCPSVGILQGARVLEKGRSEWTYALAPTRDVRHDLNKEPPQSAQNRTPRAVQPEVSWRYGWREGTDVALRFFVGGAKGEIRRALLRQSDAGVHLTAGLGVSGFVHPAYGGVCALGREEGEEDGCFSSLFGGGTVDVPIVLSRTAGDSEFYAGLRGGVLLMRGTTTYTDPAELYRDVEVTKSLNSGLAGLIFGVSFPSGPYRLTPELQILSSRTEGDRLIWFPVIGVGVTPRSSNAPVAAR